MEGTEKQKNVGGKGKFNKCFGSLNFISDMNNWIRAAFLSTTTRNYTLKRPHKKAQYRH